MRIGFVMNPVAGMGGRVGLKGTDGKLSEAKARGAEPRAPERAGRMLDELWSRDPAVELLAYGDPMGASLVREAGFEPVTVGSPAGPDTAASAETGSEDTKTAVTEFLERGVDLILFVGGDGTATDIAAATDGDQTPVLGVPAGVKVYSSVFAVSPEAAADVALTFDRAERREVVDIDEDEYREGEVNPQLRGVSHVPVADNLQSSKQTGGGTVEALAEGVATDLEDGVTYILAPGSTVGTIKQELGFVPSPIGVDVWRDGAVVVKDATEAELLDALGPDNTIVVSPIGGQGFVFGRGNPQLSPAVISQCDVTVVGSRSKLDDLRVLRVDTDDPDLDEDLQGWWRVRVGKFETRMMKLV
ncbi:MAG: hypothetical protein J07HR59_01192 [Halorubrum sp. J07HR59]|nr:MAG: hypothetical protein J07HR59_01192 [Halorubrum sp. J07HR59]